MKIFRTLGGAAVDLHELVFVSKISRVSTHRDVEINSFSLYFKLGGCVTIDSSTIRELEKERELLIEAWSSED